MSNDDLAPSLFVAMPFGTKPDALKRRKINFDEIYRTAIQPAARAAHLDAVRADEDPVGGVVHLPMFERLLLSEFVIADITLASPNVFYELGIRHATRPRSTILITAESRDIPFDLSPVRVLSYRLKKSGVLTTRAREELEERLTALLKTRLTQEASDSPLFQLIENYPGVTLAHEVTDSFKARARRLAQISREIRDAGLMAPSADARDRLRIISHDYSEAITLEPALFVDLLLAHRDCDDHDGMIRLVDSSTSREIQSNPVVREQLAFALNRRNSPGDRKRAIAILEDVLKAFGNSPETLGLLGRVHKDEYKRLAPLNGTQARDSLRAAIRIYTLGFEADPRDYYPGINAATLNLVLGTKKSLKRLDSLAGAVAIAISRRGALSSRDYWDVATVFELALLRRSRKTALRAADRLLQCVEADWQLQTTSDNAHLIIQAWAKLGHPLSWSADVLPMLETADRD